MGNAGVGGRIVPVNPEEGSSEGGRSGNGRNRFPREGILEIVDRKKGVKRKKDRKDRSKDRGKKDRRDKLSSSTTSKRSSSFEKLTHKDRNQTKMEFQVDDKKKLEKRKRDNDNDRSEPRRKNFKEIFGLKHKDPCNKEKEKRNKYSSLMHPKPETITKSNSEASIRETENSKIKSEKVEKQSQETSLMLASPKPKEKINFKSFTKVAEHTKTKSDILEDKTKEATPFVTPELIIKQKKILNDLIENSEKTKIEAIRVMGVTETGPLMLSNIKAWEKIHFRTPAWNMEQTKFQKKRIETITSAEPKFRTKENINMNYFIKGTENVKVKPDNVQKESKETNLLVPFTPEAIQKIDLEDFTKATEIAKMMLHQVKEEDKETDTYAQANLATKEKSYLKRSIKVTKHTKTKPDDTKKTRKETSSTVTSIVETNKKINRNNLINDTAISSIKLEKLEGENKKASSIVVDNLKTMKNTEYGAFIKDTEENKAKSGRVKKESGITNPIVLTIIRKGEEIYVDDFRKATEKSKVMSDKFDEFQDTSPLASTKFLAKEQVFLKNFMKGAQTSTITSDKVADESRDISPLLSSKFDTLEKNRVANIKHDEINWDKFKQETNPWISFKQEAWGETNLERSEQNTTDSKVKLEKMDEDTERAQVKEDKERNRNEERKLYRSETKYYESVIKEISKQRKTNLFDYPNDNKKCDNVQLVLVKSNESSTCNNPISSLDAYSDIQSADVESKTDKFRPSRAYMPVRQPSNSTPEFQGLQKKLKEDKNNKASRIVEEMEALIIVRDVIDELLMSISKEKEASAVPIEEVDNEVVQDLGRKMIKFLQDRHSNRKELLKIIVQTGHYEISEETFCFDLRVLDAATISKLQKLLEHIR